MISSRKKEAQARTTEPKDNPVVLEPYAFSSLVMAAIEIHGRESLGFLIGREDRQFIEGKVMDCVSVHAAYPVQSAARGRTKVGFGNLAARKRAEGTIRAVGFEIMGGFHSHPNGSAKLSRGDMGVIFEELDTVYSRVGLSSWLEIVVGIQRIDRPKASLHLKKLFRRDMVPSPGFYPWNVKPEIAGDVLITPDIAFRIKMGGYWFENEEAREALLCYSRY
jgi:proteasome lid subunit RPN8/RPN11